MKNEMIPFNSEKDDESVALKKDVSYEALKMLDELYNNEDIFICSYCGSLTELNRKKYATCESCGTYVEKI